MLFRSNAPRRFPVDNPVDEFVQEKVEYPQAIHSPDDGELVWPNGSDAPVDRQSFLAELLAERFGLPKKTSRRRRRATNSEETR